MQLSAIIIAGGKSRRMGTDKTQLIWQGKTLLQKAVDLLQNFTNDIVISANVKLQTDYPVIPDKQKNMGPMGGLQAGLQAIRYSKVLVLPADMPLLDKSVIEILIQKADEQKDINVFNTGNRMQMLVGIYDKNILPLIEKQIAEKDYKLRNLLQKSAYHLIDGSSFAGKFINVNTPDEWEKLQANNE